jgi:hypothetical protein
MKKFKLVVFNRYNVVLSDVFLIESELSDLEDILIGEVSKLWECEKKEVVEVFEGLIEMGENKIGVDLDEESYFLFED